MVYGPFGQSKMPSTLRFWPTPAKGQLILKANCQAVDSPKKNQTNKFAFFWLEDLLLSKVKRRLFVFLENLIFHKKWSHAFEINWPLVFSFMYLVSVDSMDRSIISKSYTINYGLSIILSKVRQIISVMKTEKMVFPVKKFVVTLFFVLT